MRGGVECIRLWSSADSTVGSWARARKGHRLGCRYPVRGREASDALIVNTKALVTALPGWDDGSVNIVVFACLSTRPRAVIFKPFPMVSWETPFPWFLIPWLPIYVVNGRERWQSQGGRRKEASLSLYPSPW